MPERLRMQEEQPQILGGDRASRKGFSQITLYPLRIRRRSAQSVFFRGTLAPFLRASDRPIAIACFRLLTTPPFPFFPECNAPRFSRCSAFLTLSLAAFPYFAIFPPSLSLSNATANGIVYAIHLSSYLADQLPVATDLLLDISLENYFTPNEYTKQGMVTDRPPAL
jgi:hypothetical protein